VSRALKNIHSTTSAISGLERINLYDPKAAKAFERLRLTQSEAFKNIFSSPPLTGQLNSALSEDMKRFTTMVQKNPSLFQEVTSQVQKWNRIESRLSEEFKKVTQGLHTWKAVSDTWKVGVDQSLGQVLQIQKSPGYQTLVSRILEPSRVYADFIQKTQIELQRSPLQDIAKALSASAELAQSQYLRSISQKQPVISSSLAKIQQLHPSTINLFKVQQKELIQKPELVKDDADFELIQLPTSTFLSEMSSEVLILVNDCNELWSFDREEDLFKPTRKLMVAITELPLTVATDKTSLGNIVDFLYFILYEGSGEMSRLLSEKKGVLEKDECNVIWAIKHLRNYWLRHDPDHGDDATIKKKRESLRESLEGLGFTNLPRRPEEFKALQTKLLEEIKTLLETVILRLTG
ncbi:MAG: hypothetical protein KC964_17500, partial [Candidatus Omnitrophica bacterium]|nr:hypothetical protein [Candidatus Omnitrophota bacterium]